MSMILCCRLDRQTAWGLPVRRRPRSRRSSGAAGGAAPSGSSAYVCSIGTLCATLRQGYIPVLDTSDTLSGIPTPPGSAEAAATPKEGRPQDAPQPEPAVKQEPAAENRASTLPPPLRQPECEASKEAMPTPLSADSMPPPFRSRSPTSPGDGVPDGSGRSSGTGCSLHSAGGYASGSQLVPGHSPSLPQPAPGIGGSDGGGDGAQASQGVAHYAAVAGACDGAEPEHVGLQLSEQTPAPFSAADADAAPTCSSPSLAASPCQTSADAVTAAEPLPSDVFAFAAGSSPESAQTQHVQRDSPSSSLAAAQPGQPASPRGNYGSPAAADR